MMCVFFLPSVMAKKNTSDEGGDFAFIQCLFSIYLNATLDIQLYFNKCCKLGALSALEGPAIWFETH